MISDLHSQDIILSTLAQIEQEICVKFFNSPFNYNATTADKILFITNEKKKKSCDPEAFDFNGSVVDMTVGYKCVNQADIARIVVDMLRASIGTALDAESDKLAKKYQPRAATPAPPNLLTAADRNYINAHYAAECARLTHRGLDPSYRRGLDMTDMAAPEQLSAENARYYQDKVWPLGIVMYGIADDVRNTPDHKTLERAMSQLELASSCLIFTEIEGARNLLWFGREGEDVPHFGFVKGNQSLKLSSFTHGAPGHAAHALSLLLRALGAPAASNRPDRDNYVTINWKYVEKGKEHLLETLPEASWLRQFPYDFKSATHAPANYMCGDACRLGEQTVVPLQDRLWYRTLTMGQTTELSDIDQAILDALYLRECQKRTVSPSVAAASPVEAFEEDNAALVEAGEESQNDAVTVDEAIDNSDPDQDNQTTDDTQPEETTISTDT
ncbi:zinc metalloproteinase nas-6-like [Plutella xylostella]|uniref:zinc metalloproteinase nas-6-like n=1 Tax=Plutella xylostella TaxID=51655 RepID=UPI002032CCE9|nr:zinc metalloproteinase nas-6-like [Plutella xylostella]